MSQIPPDPPDPLCGICDGTGLVTARIAAQFPAMSVGQRCPCTVSNAEIVRELPNLIDNILKGNPR